VFHDAAERSPAGAKAGRSLDDLIEHAGAGRVDEIFIALPWHAERRISALVDRLAHLPVDLKLCPDRVGYAQAMVIGESLAGVAVAVLHRQPIRDWGRIAKRAMDVGLSAVLLVLLAPLLAAIALAIRLDSPGPALFRQPRQGFNQDAFELLKFRTMRHDPGAPFVQACANDERVTAVGRWLRRNSLDELPQLINVLRGEMSVVGPRPHPVVLNAAFMRHIQRYATRHRVKPGITGLAQINGWRGETDTEEKMAGRVSNDLYYIENWSLLLDLKIIALTVLTGFARRNAY
jgi:polysaccharide biosynthesis protein PslA